MGLHERQCKNRWKKRTFDCDIDTYFRTASNKLKERVKNIIITGKYTKECDYLKYALYECYKVNFSTQLCNDLIDHYGAGNVPSND